jgi:alpha-tubulin suppressor-like RCC1 family protein
VTFTAIGAGSKYTCALAADGDIYCWGAGHDGVLGGAPDGAVPHPVSHPLGSPKFKALSVGLRRACAISESGWSYCWGYGMGSYLYHPPVGIPLWITSESSLWVPSPIGPPSRITTDIASGSWLSCGLDSAGATSCWGIRETAPPYSRGSLFLWSWWPTPIGLPGGVTVVRMAAGFSFVCAIASDDHMYCWGHFAFSSWDFFYGGWQQPIPPEAGALQYVAASTSRVCVTTSLNETLCWTITEGQPTVVERGLSFTSISAGSNTVCATTPTNAYCWGSNATRQVGDGTAVDRETPVPVAGSR